MLRIIAPALSNKVLPVPSAFSNKLPPCSVLFLWRNNKMILLKRFYDGAKNDLYVVIDFEKGQPFPTINTLPKLFFSPTETCILNGHGDIY